MGLLLACGEHSEEVSGRTYVIGTPSDASCPDTSGPDSLWVRPTCSANEDCLAAFAGISPVGTLHVVCFYGRCVSAESCIYSNAGVVDWCVCGAEDFLADNGCRAPAVCIRGPDEAEPSCQSRCGP